MVSGRVVALSGEVGHRFGEPRDESGRLDRRGQQGSDHDQTDYGGREAGEDRTPLARRDRLEISPPRPGEELLRRLRRRKRLEQAAELPVLVRSLAHVMGAPSSAFLSWARPRWSHVITVPIGTSRAAAMSRYDISSVWNRMIASLGPSSRSATARSSRASCSRNEASPSGLGASWSLTGIASILAVIFRHRRRSRQSRRAIA